MTLRWYIFLVLLVPFSLCFVIYQTLSHHLGGGWIHIPRGGDDTKLTRAKAHQNDINCANIHMVQIKRELGNGVCKRGFLAEYNGRQVVLKMAILNQKKLQKCLDFKENMNASNLWNLCYTYCTKNVMKDVLIHRELSHPNIIKMIGFCVRGDELNSTSITTHGALSIFEYGEPVTSSSLRSAPWADRLQNAIEIASLMTYFVNSPLGSLRYPDLKLRHFVMVKSRLKLIDMDSIKGNEPRCGVSKKCKYVFPCISGRCVGSNAYSNLQAMYRVLFGEVLSISSIPTQIESAVIETKRKVLYGKLDSSGFMQELKIIKRDLAASQNKIYGNQK